MQFLDDTYVYVTVDIAEDGRKGKGNERVGWGCDRKGWV